VLQTPSAAALAFLPFTQLAALEAPGPGVLVVDGAYGGPGEVAARVRRALEGRPPPRQG